MNMALEITSEQKASIQKRTITYEPIYANGMTKSDKDGSYVLFYIFDESDSITFTPSDCIVESLEKLGSDRKYTFVKIGHFSNGSQSRWNTNRGDLITIDGNRSLAARHSQNMLILNPDLYLHFIMVVLSVDKIEAHLQKSLEGIVKSIHNKQVKMTTVMGRWNSPKKLTSFNKISTELKQRIASYSK